MLYERTSQFAWTCDKIKMKEYAQRRCPDLRIPPVLWHGRDLEDLDLAPLPDNWVIKPNHASGLVFFGNRETTHEELRRATAGWLRTYERASLGEWAYRRAEHTLIVEPDLSAGGGHSLVEYKFYVFHGEVKMLHRGSNRFTAEHGERFYSPDWEPLDIFNGVQLAPLAPRPTSLELLVRDAGRLGQGFAFMRVDLYEIDAVPWFAEVTPYPAGGMEPFEPNQIEEQMGRWWSGADGMADS